MKIIKADVGKMPRDMFGTMPEITATFEDGSSKILFSYYPDEIRFTPGEFIGLTEAEACVLKTRKDRDYLQSN